MFHMADISNPTKPFKICRSWTDLLFVEFFMQGDIERIHPQTFPQISQFFDRKTTNIAKSQIGYINFIKLPSYATIIKVFPNLQVNLDAMETNKEEWTKLFDEYET